MDLHQTLAYVYGHLWAWEGSDLLTQKNYTMPESMSVVQMRSNHIKNKNVQISHV